MVPRFHTLITWLAALMLLQGLSCHANSLDPNFSSTLPRENLFGDLTSHYRVLQWKVEQGLPQNHITCLHQSADGYLWLGTVFGLARYDGIRFTIFEKATLPLMEKTDDHILGITEDSDHTLWVCAKRGLLHQVNHQWSAYLKAEPALDNTEPTGVTPARRGGVWVGVQGRIYHFTAKGRQRSYVSPFPEVRSVRMLLEDKQGRVWYADRYRVMRWDPATDESTMILNHNEHHGWVRYLHLDPEGHVNFGGRFGSWRMVDNKLEMIAGLNVVDGRQVTNEVQAIVHLEGNKAWLAEEGRLLQIKKQASTSTPQEILGTHQHPGLGSSECLLQDAESNLWVGSISDGLLLLQERRFSTLQISTNRIDNDVWTVCEDRDKTIWIGTTHDLFRLKNNQIRRYTNPKGTNYTGLVFSLLPDPDGSVWVGYGGIGLQHLKNDTYEAVWPRPLVNRDTVLHEFNIRSLYRDDKGTLWFGSLDGLHKLEGGVHSLITTNRNFPKLDIRAIHRDSNGVFWLGSYGKGLIRMEGTEMRQFTREHGLRDLEVTCIVEDKDKALWLGTGAGLTRLKDGQFKTLTHREGLFDNVVNCILLDDLDNFWISCNRGIYRIARKHANAVADGTESTLTSTPFGESDGMLSAETNGGGQPSGWKASDGTLWFPTTKGLVRIDPFHVQSNLKTPRVVIEHVIANNLIRYGDGMRPAGTGDKQVGPLNLSLAAGEARVLEIRYTATSFEEPSKVRFQYQLAGHDRNWRDAGDRRITYYTNLDPGDYRFRVRACNNHGVWGDVDESLTFSLAPFFYQTWWFYSLCVCLVLGIASGVQAIRLNIQRRILQFEKQHALERERARIAKDMHDDLGARLTHLGLVSELIESPGFNTADPTANRLPKVSALARDAVRSLDEIVWAVSPKKNSLDQLAGYLAQTAQDMITPSGLSFDLRMPQNIPAIPLTTELRHNVFLVCKEAVNNAIKHSGGARIGLTLAFDQAGGRLAITDDGRGFHTKEAEGLGNGLANMRKRAESVNASFRLESAPQHGTRVEIHFPFDTSPS